VVEHARRFRSQAVLEEQLAALQESQEPGPGANAPPEFGRGAVAALRWLLAGGPGPLTRTVTGQLPPSAAVVREMAAAEDLIYQRRSGQRDYAQGVQHALMWAQYATAAPPFPVRPPPGHAAH
jgi:hypothetical protein